MASLFLAIIACGVAGYYVFLSPGTDGGATGGQYQNTPALLAPVGQPPKNNPVFLVIPRINVDAVIMPVGLTSDGSMGVPAGPTGTAWFDLGPRPGEVGSAVIAGHEGWKDGITAVFDNLYKLQAGDQIYVQDQQGITMVFVVRHIATYRQNGDASQVFSSSDGGAHLNLITCEGVWNATEKSYSNRLVVFADLVK